MSALGSPRRNIEVSPTLTFHADEYRCGTRQRPHQHEALHFSLVLSGAIAETVGGTTEYAGALSIVAKDAGVMHANDFGRDGARLARLTLSRGTIGDLIDDPVRSAGWRWTHDPRVSRSFLRLVRRTQGLPAEFPADDPDLVDLLAAFTARPANPVRGEAPAWLSQVLQEVQEHWHPAITVTSVARKAGVHPVYLARCVRRWFGTSLGDELRRQRLRAAAAALSETRRTISDVAHAGGYADEPHLNRDFQAAVGITPGQFRTVVGRLHYSRRGMPGSVRGLQPAPG